MPPDADLLLLLPAAAATAAATRSRMVRHRILDAAHTLTTYTATQTLSSRTTATGADHGLTDALLGCAFGITRLRDTWAAIDWISVNANVFVRGVRINIMEEHGT